MNIAMVSHHTPNYQSMADITVPIKEKYGRKHGYPVFIKTKNFLYRPNLHLSFEKCAYLNQLMNEHPNIDWFWYSGCDCLITNLNIKLEGLIDNNYHFIVCKDGHGINGDVFFIRNSAEGREYMQHLDEPHACMTEQGHMWDDEHNPKWAAITKYIPQHLMNSYSLAYYPNMSGFDKFGKRSNWELGDFVLQAVTGHLPNLSSEDIYQWKINILRNYVDQIVY